MKNLTKLVSYLLITTGSIISCSKSSDPAPSLAGTWKVSTYSLKGCTDGTLNFSDTPCGTTSSPVIVTCETWVFTGTTVTVSGTALGGTLVFDYSLSGNTITYKLAGQTLSTGTYVLTPTTLAITSDYGSVGMGCTMVENFTKQ